MDGTGQALRGWLLVRQRQGAGGIAQIQQGIAAWRATGAEIGRASHLVHLADAYGAEGQPEAGLEALAAAQALVDHTGDRWREAELYRLRGSCSSSLESRVCSPPATIRLQTQQRRVCGRRSRSPWPGGEVARTASRHEPESVVALPGQADRSPAAPG